jgi:hypothetical protein
MSIYQRMQQDAQLQYVLQLVRGSEEWGNVDRGEEYFSLLSSTGRLKLHSP